MTRHSLALISLALASAPVRAAPEVPISPWNVEYDEEQCVASRKYGKELTPTYLILKPSAGGGVMRVLVSRRGWAHAAQIPGKLTFAKGSELETNLLTYGDSGTKQRVVVANVPMPVFKPNSGASSIAFASSSLRQEFATAGMAKVVAALDECLIDLQDHWNVSAKKAAEIGRYPAPIKPLSSYFLPSDYPNVAVTQSQSGTVMMGLLIDEQGKVADCTVESTSGIASLDTMSCFVIRARAQFAPALDKTGKPVKSYWCQRVTWRLDDGKKKRA